MITAMLSGVLSLLFPSTWRDPYKEAKQHYAADYVLTPGEAPVPMPHDCGWLA